MCGTRKHKYSPNEVGYDLVKKRKDYYCATCGKKYYSRPLRASDKKAIQKLQKRR